MNDFARPQFEFGNNETVATVNHGSDAGLYVEFRMDAQQDHAKSEAEGRPIFVDMPYITIMFPGDKTKKIDRPVKLKDDVDGPSDLRRFPRQWEQFKSQEEQSAEGLPIQQWSVLTKAQALELKAMGIHTVEQMSELPDVALTWLGARELRQQAINWISKAGSHKVEAKLTAENAQLKEQVEAMQLQIKDILARVDAPDPKPAAKTPKEK
jgi:hypothetical protein